MNNLVKAIRPFLTLRRHDSSCCNPDRLKLHAKLELHIIVNAIVGGPSMNSEYRNRVTRLGYRQVHMDISFVYDDEQKEPTKVS